MCSHTFAYWSVVPPTHCPICGACLGCGSRPAPHVPHFPRPVCPNPWRPQGPYYITPNITC